VYDNRFLGELDLILDPTRGGQAKEGRPVEFKVGHTFRSLTHCLFQTYLVTIIIITVTAVL